MSAAQGLPEVVCEGDETPRSKRIATLAARLALRGLQLHELASGGWLINDHHRSLVAPDLAAANRLLSHLDGQR